MKLLRFNQDTATLAGQPLDANILSQEFDADANAVEFYWSRLQDGYTGDGSATFQVGIEDLTDGGPLTLSDVDFAPNGSTPDETLPWTRHEVVGLIVGHQYRLEFRGGYGQSVPLGSGTLIYALDDVATFDAPPLWQNPAVAHDVNNDGHVSPIDALIVINLLNDVGPGSVADLFGGQPVEAPYRDVSGDGFISPIDALQVINRLNAEQAEGTPPHADTAPVPEPSGRLLALILLCTVAAWRTRRPRCYGPRMA